MSRRGFLGISVGVGVGGIAAAVAPSIYHAVTDDVDGGTPSDNSGNTSGSGDVAQGQDTRGNVVLGIPTQEALMAAAPRFRAELAEFFPGEPVPQATISPDSLSPNVQLLGRGRKTIVSFSVRSAEENELGDYKRNLPRERVQPTATDTWDQPGRPPAEAFAFTTPDRLATTVQIFTDNGSGHAAVAEVGAFALGGTSSEESLRMAKKLYDAHLLGAIPITPVPGA